MMRTTMVKGTKSAVSIVALSLFLMLVPSPQRTSGADAAVNLSSGEAVIDQKELPVTYTAVGTVRPLLEARVMAQASGNLLSVAVREGEPVVKGQEIARVEDSQLTLRLSQARMAVEAAEAQRMQAQYGKIGALAAQTQAKAEYDRVKKFLAQKAATPQQMEQAEAAYKQAKSSVDGAEEAVKGAIAATKRASDAVAEVKVALGDTSVRAPFDGTVVKRLVDPGDLAWPGRPLFQIMDSAHLRLEAHVREGLAGKVHKGDVLTIHLASLQSSVKGTVEEITPSADPMSRTFTVKVNLPPDERLLPGMFGRLEIPTGKRNVLLLPEAAVRRRGQINLVRVKSDGRWQRRLVRLGERIDQSFEVLSGLVAGEVVEVGDER